MGRLNEVELDLQDLAYAGHSRSGLSEEEAASRREAWASQAPEDMEFLLDAVDALTAQMRAAATALRALAVPAAQETADRLDGAVTYAQLARSRADLARRSGAGPWYPAHVTWIHGDDPQDGGDAA